MTAEDDIDRHSTSTESPDIWPYSLETDNQQQAFIPRKDRKKFVQ